MEDKEEWETLFDVDYTMGNVFSDKVKRRNNLTEKFLAGRFGMR